jgi:hypothetical protein
VSSGIEKTLHNHPNPDELQIPAGIRINRMRILCVALLLGALPALAAEPFTGTWKLDVASAKFSQKPGRYEIANGNFKCVTCDPPVTVKADGRDQAVSGHPS